MNYTGVQKITDGAESQSFPVAFSSVSYRLYWTCVPLENISLTSSSTDSFSGKLRAAKNLTLPQEG